jgi:cellulose binding protein with CBM2 domain
MGEHESPQSPGLPPGLQPPPGRRPARRIGRGVFAVAATTAGFAVVAWAAFFAMTMILGHLGPSSPASYQAVGCADGSCDEPAAAVAGPTLPGVGALAVRPHRPRPALGTTKHPATPLPAPAPTQRNTPVPTAIGVAIGYVAHQHREGFSGQVTITNRGAATISDWQLGLGLPGDQIRFVWNADGRLDGGVLALKPSGQDRPIQPGGSLTVFFWGAGPTTNPVSCSYDGAACTLVAGTGGWR